MCTDVESTRPSRVVQKVLAARSSTEQRLGSLRHIHFARVSDVRAHAGPAVKRTIADHTTFDQVSRISPIQAYRRELNAMLVMRAPPLNDEEINESYS